MALRILGPSAALLVLAACAQSPSDAPPSHIDAPIVNGSAETGWPGVGALTVTYPFGGYAGSFCTGTLIASRWVLTAGHCLAPNESGDSMTPSMVKFLVGNDANPGSNGQPKNGTLYQSDAFYIHPQFDGDALENDVALLHLASAVPSPTIYPVNSNFLNAVGQDAFYVGFGQTSGLSQNTSGAKRSTNIKISWIYPEQFTSDYVSTNTCFGDSGGPSFLQLGGSWKVIGVNSAVSVCNPNTNPSCNVDPCKRGSIATRADAYASWIASVTNGPAPSCIGNAAMCACAGACKGDGSCDNTLCQVADCETTYDCLVDCGEDVACQSGCYTTATALAQGQLDALFQCTDSQCGDVPEADYGTCVGQHCPTQISACFPIGNGPASCRDVYDCIFACADGDEGCPNDCFETGTTVAQGQYDDLVECLNTQCGTLSGDAFQTCAGQKCGGPIDDCFPTRTGPESCESVADCIGACSDSDDGCPFACFETGTTQAQAAYDAIASCADSKCGTQSGDAFTTCLTSKCASEYNACFPPSNCALTGGQCPSGQACFPTLTGATDCFPSNGKKLDAACDDGGANLDCGDGAVCVDAMCAAFCRGPVDCGPGHACESLDLGIDGVGSCGCEDFDGDGACASVDCDDHAAAVHPGAIEACGDGVDNDCEGGTDEGCDNCTDADHDSYCADVDCADGDASVHPGAAEKCGDGVDNDCANGADDGCASCTDADHDGYCADIDCFDDDADSHPGAAEVCGDGKDQNCSGAADEGCETSADPGPEPGAEASPESGGDLGGDTQPTSVGRSAGGCAGGEGGGVLGLGVMLALALAARRARTRQHTR